jgi:hypothetical protein
MAIILIKVERFNSIFQFPSKEESVGISHVSLCERALKTDGLYYVTNQHLLASMCKEYSEANIHLQCNKNGKRPFKASEHECCVTNAGFSSQNMVCKTFQGNDYGRLL